jgi:hypothetical protein
MISVLITESGWHEGICLLLTPWLFIHPTDTYRVNYWLWGVMWGRISVGSRRHSSTRLSGPALHWHLHSMHNKALSMMQQPIYRPPLTISACFVDCTLILSSFRWKMTRVVDPWEVSAARPPKFWALETRQIVSQSTIIPSNFNDAIRQTQTDAYAGHT